MLDPFNPVRLDAVFLKISSTGLSSSGSMEEREWMGGDRLG
jgi:hypothetical protein